VPATDFSFEIRFDTGLGDTPALLENVTAAVLRHAGCAPEATAGLSLRLRQAIEQHGRLGACGVQFRTEDGELHVVFSDNAGAQWRASYPVTGA
jgi:hypothetical protein